MPTKTCQIIMLSLVIGFGIVLIFTSNEVLIAASIGMVEVGIGGSFTLIYFINTEYFPPLFVAFAFAVCQFASRSSTIFSYLLSDLQAPIPMILLVATGGLALITLMCLSKPNYKQEEEAKRPSNYYQLPDEEQTKHAKTVEGETQ